MWMLLKSIKYSLQVLIWAAPQLVITTTQCRGQRSSRFQVRGSCHRWCGCCRRPSPPQPAFQGSYVLYTARIACVNPLSDLRNVVQRKRGLRCTGTWCGNTCWWQQYCNEMRVILPAIHLTSLQSLQTRRPSSLVCIFHQLRHYFWKEQNF